MTDQGGSHQAISFRRHPAVLTRPFMTTLGGLIVVAAISEVSSARVPAFTILVWAIWGVLLLRLIWKTAGWWTESLRVTPEGVSLNSGLLSRTMVYTPMTKVTNMNLQESLLGRLLGYGELVLELEGGSQPYRIIDYVPYSDKLYLELCNWIFFSG
jgi:uncharacterized membrane protein YdbT with pleckstrin-like domain